MGVGGLVLLLLLLSPLFATQADAADLRSTLWGRWTDSLLTCWCPAAALPPLRSLVLAWHLHLLCKGVMELAAGPTALPAP